jgi:hypothetical protein
MDQPSSLWQDLRYGLRAFRRDHRFFLLAVFALALGIGGATIGFSLFYNLLLDPYAAKDTQRWVVPAIHDLKQSGSEGDNPWFSIPEYQAIHEQNHVFEDSIASYHADILFNNGTGSRVLAGLYLTANSFNFLGVPALLGRGITPEDGRPGAPAVFVIGYNLWKSQFRADPNVIGHSFILDGEPRNLVGVMPWRFLAGGVPVWLPLDLT